MWRVYRPDALLALEDEELRARLDWYYDVMEDRKPAKYVLAATLEAGDDVESMPLDELWSLHDRLGKELDALWSEVRQGYRDARKPLDHWYRRAAPINFLDVKSAIVGRVVRSCTLCERRCRIDRARSRGACRLDVTSRVGSYFLHIGEEAPLVPSGTIFFTGCNFRCVYCQNWDISQREHNGVPVTPEELASMAIQLRAEGARNVNWVGGEPTVNMHVIIPAIRELARRRVNVPQLWNSNMYMSEEGLRLLLHVMDIWLPDFKYGSDACAARLSAVRGFHSAVARNLSAICGRGENIIVRHLVLPGHVKCCTFPVLSWLAENCPHALVNIMDQYRPEYMTDPHGPHYSERFRELSRRPTRHEIEEAYAYASRLGLAWEKCTR